MISTLALPPSVVTSHPAITPVLPKPQVTSTPVTLPLQVKEPSASEPATPATSPRYWNLALGIPALGVISDALWGITGFARKHLDTTGTYLFPGAKHLIQAEPLINTLYGASNGAAALTQGYGYRTVAYGIYSGVSLLTAPWVHRYNRTLTQVMDNPQAASYQALKTVLSLKPRMWVLDAVAPIFILSSLYTATKIAQSTPNAGLQHPKGRNWHELEEAPPADKKLSHLLIHNLIQETKAVSQLLSHPLQATHQALASFKEAVAPPKNDQDTQHPSLIERLDKTIFTPWCYLNKAVGFAGFSMVALGLYTAATKNPTALAQLRDHTKVDELARQAGVNSAFIKGASGQDTPLNQLGKTALNVLMPWGSLAGTAAVATSNFHDWPPALSFMYRLAAIPLVAACVGSFAHLAGVDKKNYGVWLKQGHVLGVSSVAWNKIASSISATAYLYNLLLKTLKEQQSSDAPSSSSSHSGGIRPRKE
ncbi:MAG: hypothetical protein ACKO34_00860 [Vampirovibrionales bacterium]